MVSSVAAFAQMILRLIILAALRQNRIDYLFPTRAISRIKSGQSYTVADIS